MPFCAGCDTYVKRNKINTMLGEDDYEEIYCKECLDEELKNENLIDNPDSFYFLSEKNDDELFMGFELEVEREYDIGIQSEKFIRFLRGEKVSTIFFLKEDGSLDNGFEIVSHPFTLRYAKNHLNFKKMLNWLHKHKFNDGKGNAGLHIHINRRFLTNEDVIKMRMFFSLNEEQLFVFSKRGDENNYCKYEEFDEYFLKDLSTQEERRYALNITNDNTIEMRIFNHTLNYSRFMAYLEFADALTRYCKNNTLSDVLQQTNRRKSWNCFVKYVKANKYKYLSKILKKDNLLCV